MSPGDRRKNMKKWVKKSMYILLVIILKRLRIPENEYWNLVE